MRWVALTVGLVFLVAGGVLWTLPVYTDTEVTLGGSSGGTQQGYVIGNAPPLAIFTPSLTYYAGWTAPGNVTVTVYDCGGTPSGCSTTRHVVVSGNGFSGGVSWNGAKGEYYVVVPSGSAQVGVSYAEPLVGGAVGATLTVLGALLALYGALTGPQISPGPVGRTPAAPGVRPSGAAPNAPPRLTGPAAPAVAPGARPPTRPPSPPGPGATP